MIRKHVIKEISSIVVHAGFTLEMLEMLRNTKRIMGMVSKGGSFTSAWMLQSGKENPFCSHFNEICEALSEKNVVLSLGNTMRSRCIYNHMDRSQEMEMDMNATLARRANELGVQVIIEGMTISLGVLAGLLRRVLERITSATSLPLSTSPFPTRPRSEKEWWPLK